MLSEQKRKGILNTCLGGLIFGSTIAGLSFLLVFIGVYAEYDDNLDCTLANNPTACDAAETQAWDVLAALPYLFLAWGAFGTYYMWKGIDQLIPNRRKKTIVP